MDTETTTQQAPAKVVKPAKAPKAKAPKVVKASKLPGFVGPPKPTKNVVPATWREKVGKLGSCGDAFATALGTFLGDKVNGERLALLEKLAKANGLTLERWAGKNVGMVRMNLGNVLRGRVVRGEKVVVPGVRTWEAKPAPKQDSPKPQPKPEAPKA